MSEFEFDLSRSLKVKSNGAARLPIYDFPLVANSNHMSISPFRSCSNWKIVLLTCDLLSLGQNFGPLMRTLTPGRFVSKSNHFFLESQGRLPPKMKLIMLIG